MENRKKLLAVLALSWLTALQAEARFRNSFSRSQGSATATQYSRELPFHLLHSRLIVTTGTLNGVKGQKLLIDTGTNPTVLDVAVAQKLGVQGKTGDLQTLGGGIPGTMGVLSSVALGPIVAKSVPVFVTDLSFMKREVGEKVDAVIGLDILKASSFSINYEKREVEFGPAPPYRDSVPFAGGPPMITVDVEIDGQMKRMLVDTGAEGLFLFRGESQSNKRTQAPEAQTGSHVSLTRNREQVEIPNVRLGNSWLSNQSAYLVHTRGTPLHGFDGLLGLGTLGIKEVVFDFERQRLGWR